MKAEQFCDVPAPAGSSWMVVGDEFRLRGLPQREARIEDAAERLANAAPADRSDADRLTLGLCADRPEGCPPGESKHRWVYDPHGCGSGWALQGASGATLRVVRGMTRGDLYDAHAVALVTRYHGWPAPVAAAAAALEPVPPELPEGWRIFRGDGWTELWYGSQGEVARVIGDRLVASLPAHLPYPDSAAAVAHLLAVAVPTVATGGELYAVAPEVTRG